MDDPLAPRPDAWIARPEPRPAARAHLYCLPYAGGGIRLFHGWSAALPTAVEVRPLQLPGRERRIREPAIARMEELVPALVGGLAPHLDRPFALFGHSMGALIAYELAVALEAGGHPAPERLLLSAARAPQLAPTGPALHALPELELVAALQALEGTPPGVLEHEELRKLVLPTLRADFELVETYRRAAPARVSAAATLFSGTRDRRAPAERMQGWRTALRAEPRRVAIDGGHFFLEHERERFLGELAGELRRWLDPPAAPRA